MTWNTRHILNQKKAGILIDYIEGKTITKDQLRQYKRNNVPTNYKNDELVYLIIASKCKKLKLKMTRNVQVCKKKKRKLPFMSSEKPCNEKVKL